MKKEIFDIEGMSCTACSSGIESALKRKKGIQNIHVDLLNHKAIIEFDPHLITLKEIFAFIQKLGYTPHKQGLIEKIDSALLTPKRRIFLAFIFTLPPLILSMLPMFSPLPLSPQNNALIQLLCTLIVMHLGRIFYIRGFKKLFALNPNMDSLVALGSGSAFIYSLYSLIAQNFHALYFESVCVILLFVLLGKMVEEKAKQNAQSSLLSLASLKENEVIRIQNQIEEKISISKIAIGDILKITPQSTIPTEGILLQGYANLDLSNLSGESLPLHKQEGEKIPSGAFNLNTTFLMQATQIPQESNYHKILDLVQNTLISKPPIAKLADRIALYFVPFVIVLALFSSGFWLVFSHNFDLSLQIFCSVLLISCPCALGLSTPLALNIASTLAHKRGAFFKDSTILELVGKSQVIFFDKTGTLTHKELQIQNITSTSTLQSDELLAIAASLESHSHHIIAQSLLSYAKSRIQTLPLSSQIQILEGLGISGEIKGKRYKIGSARSFNPSPSNLSHCLIIGEEGQEGDKVLGYIEIEEQIRKEAYECIDFLQKQHITPILLSGDSQIKVQRVAQALGIEYIANALPQDKLQAIQDQKGKITMMIGDGLNDMLALSHADISISLGEANQGAIASANLIILNNDLKNIPFCIRLSRATMRNIKQNLFWAFGYNICMIPIACGALAYFEIFLSPMFASLAMTLSSLSVVLNAQRLKNFKG